MEFVNPVKDHEIYNEINELNCYNLDTGLSNGINLS